MVALTQGIIKLEKKTADRSQTGYLDGKVVYQPRAENLVEALAILTQCGAVKEVRS